MPRAADLRVVLFLALEEQLAVSRHEVEVACLWGFIMAEDHEQVVVAGIQQGAGSALAAMQLWTGVNLCQVVPRFPEHIRLEELAELVNNFAVTADVIIIIMDVEEVIRGDN